MRRLFRSLLPAVLVLTLSGVSTPAQAVDGQAPTHTSTSSNVGVPPSAPVNVSSRAAVNEAKVTWEPPADLGTGGQVTRYRVSASPGGRSCEVDASLDPEVRSCWVTGLSNGVEYTFTATASNSYGTSGLSEPSNPVVPAVDTTAPVGAEWSWSPTRVSSAGGTVSYQVRITDSGSGFTERSSAAYLMQGSANFIDSADMVRVSGDEWDGVYRATFQVPSGSRGGVYDIWSGSLIDRAGNSRRQLFHDDIIWIGTPASPTGVTAEPVGDDAVRRAVRVAWAAPTDDGGHVITGYQVTGPDGSTWDTSDTSLVVPAGQWPADRAASYTVRARNAIGLGEVSAPSTVVTVPADRPDSPTEVVARPSDRSATVSWQAPAGNGAPVTGYTVTPSPTGDPFTVPEDRTTATVPGLVNGTAYTFTVTAHNTAGASGPSPATAQVVPYGTPGAPGSATARRGDRSAKITWSSASSTNGSPVTGYTVTAYPGGKTVTVPGDRDTATVTGLANGTGYRFTVTASNMAGAGSPSALSNRVVPARRPDRPARPAATAVHRSAVVTWRAPYNGGSSIARYRIVTSVGPDRVVGASVRKTVFRKLPPGRYSYRVVAINAVGASPESLTATVRIRR